MPEFDKSKFDPKAAAEARKAEIEEIGKKLEQGVKDIFNGENFKKYLAFCAKLPRYSVNNQILIMMQKPEARMCQSYTGWKEMKRFVKKGEKGIRIMAPAPYKMQQEQDKKDDRGNKVLDKDGEPVKETVEVTVNAYKPVSTFDISQTEGEPVPMPGIDELTGAVEGYKDLLAAIQEVVPVPISFEQIESGAKGFYHLEENRIAIQEGMSEAQTVKTLLHEASHQALHSREALEQSGESKSKNQKETEAESVAYVVCQHYGIDTSDYSFPYVATWSQDKDVPELKASLDTIRRTAAGLITKIDEKLQEKTAQKDKERYAEVIDAEIPFEGPEVPKPEGFIEIEPPVEFPKGQQKEHQKAVETPAEKKEEKEKSIEKKTSVKDKLKKGKVKLQKTKTQKKDPKKDLQEAI